MKLVKTVALAVALSTVAMGANAQTNNNAMAGQPYAGVKVGQFDVDGASKKATAYGVYGGYKFNENFGAEVEFVGSDDAEYVSNVDYNVKTYGAYGVYDYAFPNSPFFVKGKIGVAHSALEAKNSTRSSSVTNKDTGFAYGVGAGYAPNDKFGVQVEYNKIANDANLITLGAHLKF